MSIIIRKAFSLPDFNAIKYSFPSIYLMLEFKDNI